MPEIVTRKHRRGFLGWFFLLLFWAYNAGMLLKFFEVAGEYMETRGALARGADPFIFKHQLGVQLGMTLRVLVQWAIGFVILGALAYFSRGKTIEVETKSD